MRVYADIRCLQDENYARRGVGFHSAGILRHVRSHLNVDEVVGVIDPALPALADDLRALVDTVQTARVPQRSTEPDIFIELSPMTHDPAPFGPMLKRGGVVSAAVVYDFIPMYDRPRYLPNTTAVRSYLKQLAWLKLYDRFCPISDWAADDLRKTLGICSSRIQMAGACVRGAFLQGADRPNPKGFTLPFKSRDYYLFVGGGDPRKNADAVIDAHAQLCQRLKEVPNLIIVGNYDAGTRDRLNALAAEKSVGRSRPLWVKGMEDDHLAALYRHALVTLSPSYMEGFSLPIVESIGCGTPVLAADNSAQAELVTQPEARFRADDHNRLAYLMERIYREPEFRDELVVAQKHNAERFSEENVASRFWNCVRSAWETRRGARDRIRRKPRLAILSPFPPDRSGVADYTSRSIYGMAKYADIDVYTETENPTPHPGVRQFQPLSRYPLMVQDYDQILSVSGNSHFHIKILEYHREFGGAILQHDNRLAELYSWWRGPEEFAQMASKRLRREVSVGESQNWFAHPNLLPTMFFDEIVEKAAPLILHSRVTQEWVRREYQMDAAYLPFCSYRDFTDEEISPTYRAEARRRLGIPADRIAVISLGIVSEQKGVSECIWALEQLRTWGVPADLYFVGDVDAHSANHLKDLAAKLSISDGVHFMDRWISDDDYRDFVLAADYAIQLRKHRFGGLSGAVMDCITAGLPTVANIDLADAMEAPEYVRRIPDALSPTLIAERILQSVENDAHRCRDTHSRQEYLAEHHFDHYAKRMMQVLGLA